MLRENKKYIRRIKNIIEHGNNIWVVGKSKEVDILRL